MIADSLPDLFGNIIFRTWMESTRRDMKDISVLEQLAYVGNRGMGALEYHPNKSLSPEDTVNINEITEIVSQVLDQKRQQNGLQLNHDSLFNIFKIGTSAGGMRPKILVSQHKSSGVIIPGDVASGNDYNHYLVKLGMDDEARYSRELVEYAYYLAAIHAGIDMMECRMIDEKHFATVRFDRLEGKKKHVLTATGITGLNYMDPKDSSYEHLFDLLVFLKCPHRDIEQLYRRMVFNLVFANHDDHLKNHSVIYNEDLDSWNLSPAYDITYSLNPELNIKTRSRALSVNGKRNGIDMDDLALIAEKYTIKNHKKVIVEVQDTMTYWASVARDTGVPARIIELMLKNFMIFV